MAAVTSDSTPSTLATVSLCVGLHCYVLPWEMYSQHFAFAFNDAFYCDRDGFAFGLMLRAMMLPMDDQRLAYLASLSDYDLNSVVQEAEAFRLEPLRELAAAVAVPPLLPAVEEHAVTFIVELLKALPRHGLLRELARHRDTEQVVRDFVRRDRRLRGFLADILEGKQEYNQNGVNGRLAAAWIKRAFPITVQYYIARFFARRTTSASAGASTNGAAAAAAAETARPAPSAPPAPAVPVPGASAPSGPSAPQGGALDSVGSALQSAADLLERLSISWRSGQ